MDRKCYKSINMPKNEQKNLVFRIVRQIPAKMRLGSQYLCGFPEGTVEMREARLRALTHYILLGELEFWYFRRNERSPTKGIDTLYFFTCYLRKLYRRNERSPTKGIDT